MPSVSSTPAVSGSADSRASPSAGTALGQPSGPRCEMAPMSSSGPPSPGRSSLTSCTDGAWTRTGTRDPHCDAAPRRRSGAGGLTDQAAHGELVEAQYGLCDDQQGHRDGPIFLGWPLATYGAAWLLHRRRPGRIVGPEHQSTRPDVDDLTPRRRGIPERWALVRRSGARPVTLPPKAHAPAPARDETGP